MNDIYSSAVSDNEAEAERDFYSNAVRSRVARKIS
jgi:hypothetical protein